MWRPARAIRICRHRHALPLVLKADNHLLAGDNVYRPSRPAVAQFLQRHARPLRIEITYLDRLVDPDSDRAVTQWAPGERRMTGA